MVAHGDLAVIVEGLFWARTGNGLSTFDSPLRNFYTIADMSVYPLVLQWLGTKLALHKARRSGKSLRYVVRTLIRSVLPSTGLPIRPH